MRRAPARTRSHPSHTPTGTRSRTHDRHTTHKKNTTLKRNGFEGRNKKGAPQRRSARRTKVEPKSTLPSPPGLRSHKPKRNEGESKSQRTPFIQPNTPPSWKRPVVAVVVVAPRDRCMTWIVCSICSTILPNQTPSYSYFSQFPQSLSHFRSPPLPSPPLPSILTGVIFLFLFLLSSVPLSFPSLLDRFLLLLLFGILRIILSAISPYIASWFPFSDCFFFFFIGFATPCSPFSRAIN